MIYRSQEDLHMVMWPLLVLLFASASRKCGIALSDAWVKLSFSERGAERDPAWGHTDSGEDICHLLGPEDMGFFLTACRAFFFFIFYFFEEVFSGVKVVK